MKPPTIVTTLFNSIINEEERLGRIELKSQISVETEKLMKELDEIENKKKKGFDVSENIAFIERKFQLLEDAKERIIRNELENLKKERNKTVQPRREVAVAAVKNTPANARATVTNKSELIDCINEIMNRKVNIYLIFHCCVFDQSSRIEDCKKHLNSFLEKNHEIKIAITVFYPNYIKKSPDKKFHDYKSFSKIEFQESGTIDNLEKLQDEVININEDEKALSVLCNIATYNCTHRRMQIENFIDRISKANPQQQLIDYREISIFNRILDHKQRTDLNKLFEDLNLNSVVNKKREMANAEALYLLKKNNIKSIDEYKQLIKNPRNTCKNFLLSDYAELIDFNCNIKSEDNEFIFTKIDQKTTSVSVEIIRTFKKSKYYHEYYMAEMWFTYFSRKKTHLFFTLDYSLCLQFLEIHETAKFFINQFNEYLGEEKLIIPNARVLFMNGENYYTLEKYIYRTFERRNDAKFNYDIRNPIMQAFMHFCYLFSKQKLIVIDLRTIQTDSRFLLTEPIIFSSTNKYGSSNLGIEGIQQLIIEHKCNTLCDKFKSKLK